MQCKRLLIKQKINKRLTKRLRQILYFAGQLFGQLFKFS
nr:MAG TPA: hypothetical protein [Bacteriophage sp.]DAK43470.1 MAG TPA: hypothetical protein [Caudoviricetes sp.]